MTILLNRSRLAEQAKTLLYAQEVLLMAKKKNYLRVSGWRL
jgi:hypothetical protein